MMDSNLSVKTLARDYAKKHGITMILGFRENHGEFYAIVVKKYKNYNGVSYYTFGRLYHVFGTDFTYDQCGCAFFSEEKAAMKAAFAFFGIK